MLPDPSIGRTGLTGNVDADRSRLRGLMGRLPTVAGPVECRVIGTQAHGGFTLESLILELNGFEPVPALLTLPKTPKPTDGYPTVLFNHSHGGRYDAGKAELLSSAPYMHPKPYAESLAAIGVATLAIDHWGFGERRGENQESQFKDMLWRGMVLWGMMVFDSLRALDYVCQDPRLDARRIGTLGMSIGSTMAWWLAALDERVRVCVDICCLTDFDQMVRERGLPGHGVYYFVPGLLAEFSTADINSLIAPRRHLSLAGNYDSLTPVIGLDRVEAALKATYDAAGARERWELRRWDVGHLETLEMRRVIVDYLTAHL